MKKHKLFVVNVEKEEAWINGFIEQGYRLKRVEPILGSYEFVEISENEVLPIVKIDFRTFEKQHEFDDYIAMFEDSGWKHIYGTKSGGTQYFERVSEEAGEDIFSDRMSKVSVYQRICKMWLGLTCLFAPTLIVYYQTGIFNLHDMFHMKEQYYTPGLWEMKGAEFWGAFLFETPFAIFRAFPPLLILLMIYLCFGARAFYLYQKEKRREKG